MYKATLESHFQCKATLDAMHFQDLATLDIYYWMTTSKVMAQDSHKKHILIIMQGEITTTVHKEQ